MRDKDNEALIHLIGRGNVETVVSHDIIGRLMLMSVRQPGLAEVYGSVLGFEGDEFYTKHWKKLIGVKYKDVHLMLPDAVPVGVKLESGAIELNPRHDYAMGPSDELVVIAEDNDTYKPKQKHKCTPGKVPKLRQSEDEREFILFAGWRVAICATSCSCSTICARPGRRFTSWRTCRSRSRRAPIRGWP